jgi:hypothetical protein
LQVGESTLANKDGFRLERICVGALKKIGVVDDCAQSEFQQEYI